MRRFISFFLLTIFIYGCSAFQDTGRVLIISGFDFTQYADKGFLFTPENYTDKYESMGLITIQMVPAVKSPEVNMNVPRGYRLYTYMDTEAWIQDLDPNELVFELYKKAVAMGGNAVIRLQIKNVDFPNGRILIPGYEVSGFVIKRLK